MAPRVLSNLRGGLRGLGAAVIRPPNDTHKEETTLRVAVRVRPVRGSEEARGIHDIIKVVDGKVVVVLDADREKDYLDKVQRRTKERQFAYDIAVPQGTRHGPGAPTSAPAAPVLIAESRAPAAAPPPTAFAPPSLPYAPAFGGSGFLGGFGGFGFGFHWLSGLGV
mmetsp:Transcript_26540/g.85071  ORF Transcript_26540/g.85071 Transcript_26540/m.85071 type:complete len:166 (-) Transcript_26540:360-857(-)